MAASSEYSRSRLALGFDEGAQLVWDPKRTQEIMPFASDMIAPRVAINRGGYVIAAADKSVEVYDSKEGKLVFVAKFDKLPAAPISVMSAPQPNQFAILAQNGDLLVFEV
jgi:hypothetical protein